MFESLTNVHSFLWVFLQTTRNKVFGRLCYLCLFRKKYLFLYDLYQIVRMPDFKWTHSIQHLVGQHSNTPDIHFAAVVFIFDYLGRSIQWSSALSISEYRSPNSPPEITQFDGILMQQNIFSLYISVNNISFMHMLNSRTNFFHILLHISFFKRLFAYLLVNIGTQTRLNQKIYFLCIRCITIDIQKIRVEQS